ncbi:MAG: RagB/SusD family nutrient uptake outer membrane protein [Cytophagales bacterium]|nr:RagB/SusD family nutrient uptake outer membrane protein [Cytophagales bacterium]
MNKISKISFLIVLLMLSGVVSCSLDEELNDTLNTEQGKAVTTVDALLKAAYESMRLPYQDQSRYWAATEHTTDEAMGPTRGGDWDDNGVWRVLHDHTWDADHAFLGDTFSELLRVSFKATDILTFDPSPRQAAEALFLRAFIMFTVADGWDQVPFREPGENLLLPSSVIRGEEAINKVISDVEMIMGDLPDGPASKSNKDAARALLMKAYLNRGVFKNRQSPTFEVSDMNKVIELADEITASPRNYEISENVYDNFAPNNGEISTENIFTNENIPGQPGDGNSVRSRWFCTLHYNQNPSGWNGFTTIADFYDKFDSNDLRLTDEYEGQTDKSGIKMGFLIGQQFDSAGTALQDRKGNPLSFTKEVSLKEIGNDLEVKGIRVIKYPIDYNNGDDIDNDLVIYRYADVLLMKAEAILRGGTPTNGDTPLSLVNSIREKRGVGLLTSVDLDLLLDERGFELYWEGHRRQDLIRFGKFLDAYSEKPVSGPERLLFAIPSAELAVNPNLEQNPGYVDATN